jgi:hypothetical protein
LTQIGSYIVVIDALMNMKEIEKHLQSMMEIFGSLPDPIHQPKRFKHFLDLYEKIYLQKQKNNV